jgi:hypothetical protein
VLKVKHGLYIRLSAHYPRTYSPVVVDICKLRQLAAPSEQSLLVRRKGFYIDGSRRPECQE